MKRLLVALALLLAACGPGITTVDHGGFRTGTVEHEGMDCVVLFSRSGYIERGIDCDWESK